MFVGLLARRRLTKACARFKRARTELQRQIARQLAAVNLPSINDGLRIRYNLRVPTWITRGAIVVIATVRALIDDQPRARMV